MDVIQENSFIGYWSKQSSIYADKIFARYTTGDQDAYEPYKNLSYEQVDRISTNLACEWKEALQGIKAVGFIDDHSVSYLLSILAIMKLDILFIALSPRNSPSGIASILKKCDSKLIITSEKYNTLADNTAKEMEGCGIITYEPIDIEGMSNQPLNSLYCRIIPSQSEANTEKPVIVIHSSGTTGPPKPIFISNRYLINMTLFFQTSFNYSYPEMPYNSSTVFLLSTPLYHLFGQLTVFSNIRIGGSIVFLRQLPPSAKEVIFALKYNKCTITAFPPLILEQLLNYCKEENDFSALQQPKIMFIGGAPLKQELGDFCQAKRINVRTVYGSTEIGAFMASNLRPLSDKWNSVRVTPTIKDYHSWEPYNSEPGLYHLVIKSNSPFSANNISNREDGHYSTNDLFKETPPNSGYYIYYGRMDDILVMENGEKTNPLPIEATIRQCPIVHQCAVFGQGCQCTGVLVELSPDECQKYAPDEMVNLVYSAVQKANKEAPSHSMILKQMIKILPLNKTLPATDKGTIARKKSNEQYKDMIDKLYEDFLTASTSLDNSSNDASEWSPEKVKMFLIESAADVLGLTLADLKDTTQSLFDLGLNSLLSIQLRNRISQAFGPISQNFLFQNPTIDQIQESLSTGNVSGATTIEKSLSKTEEILDSYLERASRDFEVAKSAYIPGQEQVVLLTGATGSLGSFMLCDLLKSPCVSKVYCLVRGKESGALNRIYHAFESRNLDTSLLDTSKLVALPMNLNDERLGFSQDFYAKLKTEVTIVQHCAWLLDFNHPVEHYEKECIQGLYNLVKFSYHQTNPIHLHFISSISASAGWGSVIPESPLPRNTKVAMPMGYAQSKYIVEHLFNYLTKEKKLPCIIERLGQVCGDSINGVWNTNEQYPLMFVGGGNIMKTMPSIDINVDWIPVNYASSCIVDIMIKTAGKALPVEDSVFNIVNPQTVMWTDVLNAMRLCGMKFKTVTIEEWITQLRQEQDIPAFKLLDFYENSFRNISEAQVWSTSKSSYLCPFLKDVPAFDINLLSKYISYWKSVGFYKEISK
ncbi:hypothetical protein CLU79DRAFT_785955 [Phycomyces nitens]|nr:hypothetical protein CLU79DRAFT_785955 [Phycomyces nitens]